MLKWFVNKVKLQPQFIVNLLLMVCTVNLKAFYLLFINLVWYKPLFVDVFVFARIGQNSLKNQFFLKKVFCENGYPEKFIDKYFKTFLDNIHLVKENLPTVEIKVYSYSFCS